MRFYAQHFTTVEVDSTYYALPSERNAALWAARTPSGFRFHVKAFAWLTQHSTDARRLPHALRTLLPAEARQEPRCGDPPAPILDAAFAMFASALAPLRVAGKLGCILLQLPPWFSATPVREAYVASYRRRLGDDRLAIELRHRSWFDGRTDRTLAFLADHGFVLVGTDAPAAPAIPQPPWLAFDDVAYIRFHGRNRRAWFRRTASAAERFRYLYTEDELRGCAARLRTIRSLRGATPRTVHAIFNNCYADYGVRNARMLQDLLARERP